MVIFNEAEAELIRNEFTYNDPSRFTRNERPQTAKTNDDMPWDCFTELNLDSSEQLLRNESSKSNILAPFNSSFSN